MTFKEFRAAAMALSAEQGLGTVICGVDQHGNHDREEADLPTWNLTVFRGQTIVANACFRPSPEDALADCRRQIAFLNRDPGADPGVDPVT